MRDLIEGSIFSVGLVSGIGFMLILDLWIDIELVMAQRFFMINSPLTLSELNDQRALTRTARSVFRSVILGRVLKTLLLMFLVGYSVLTHDQAHWWLVGTLLVIKIWSLTSSYEQRMDELTNHSSAVLIEYFNYHLGYKHNEPSQQESSK